MGVGFRFVMTTCAQLVQRGAPQIGQIAFVRIMTGRAPLFDGRVHRRPAEFFPVVTLQACFEVGLSPQYIVVAGMWRVAIQAYVNGTEIVPSSARGVRRGKIAAVVTFETNFGTRLDGSIISVARTAIAVFVRRVQIRIQKPGPCFRSAMRIVASRTLFAGQRHAAMHRSHFRCVDAVTGFAEALFVLFEHVLVTRNVCFVTAGTFTFTKRIVL
jgi:hypothetical protein